MSKPKKSKAFVIKYDGVRKSYYHSMTRIGPRFGATIDETPRFVTARAAHDVLVQMPALAAVVCEVEEIEVAQ